MVLGLGGTAGGLVAESLVTLIASFVAAFAIVKVVGLVSRRLPGPRRKSASAASSDIADVRLKVGSVNVSSLKLAVASL